MKKFISICIIAIILAIIGLVVFRQTTTPKRVKLLPDTPTNFNLIFKYGIGGRNKLNTFEKTYTKDLVMNPPVTTKMQLSSEELNNIYQKIK